jgi:hypothetical protein
VTLCFYFSLSLSLSLSLSVTRHYLPLQSSFRLQRRRKRNPKNGPSWPEVVPATMSEGSKAFGKSQVATKKHEEEPPGREREREIPK